MLIQTYVSKFFWRVVLILSIFASAKAVKQLNIRENTENISCMIFSYQGVLSHPDG